MGQRFDPNRLRAECAAAGVVAEATEIIILRARDDLSFGVIARTLEMKPATVHSLYTRGTDRLREYYRRTAEAREAKLEAAPPVAPDGSPLGEWGHAREVLRAFRGRVSSPPTPQFDELDRRVGCRCPLVTPGELVRSIRARDAARVAPVESRWERSPIHPGSKVNPDQAERAKPRPKS